MSKKEQKTTKPKILDSFFTDKNENKIEKLTTENLVTLHIKTFKMIGKSITIDLSNSGYNFYFKRKKIKNNLLKDYIIHSDNEKIDLKVKFNAIENTL